jgi:hypothetical protein
VMVTMVHWRLEEESSRGRLALVEHHFCLNIVDFFFSRFLIARAGGNRRIYCYCIYVELG